MSAAAEPGSAGSLLPGHTRHFGLDLVRAIAILLVMLSHYSNNLLYWFNINGDRRAFFAGTLGVELFFVLSGFLIGQILLDIAWREPGWRSLAVFLVRRWMRTLPLYFLWLAVLLVVWPPAQGGAATVLRFATFTQNLLQPMPGDDWFAVSWSLAIEEWFYLLFGCALILTAALWRSRAAIWVPLVIFLIVPLILRLSVPAFADGSTHIQDMIVFRLDEIAYGVLMAELYRRNSWVFRHPFLPLCLGLLLIGRVWLGYRLFIPHRFAPALIYNYVVIGCALCLPAALRLRTVPRWLAIPVRGLSAQSYGLYIMHETILVDLAQGFWGRHIVSDVQAAAIALILPFLLSYLSFRFFETPLLRRRPAQWPDSGRGGAVTVHAPGEVPG